MVMAAAFPSEHTIQIVDSSIAPTTDGVTLHQHVSIRQGKTKGWQCRTSRPDARAAPNTIGSVDRGRDDVTT
jgi:hypothetical protein